MDRASSLVLRLHAIRNRYGSEFFKEKSSLLNKLEAQVIKGKRAITTYSETLLFLIAYPDNKAIGEKAAASLIAL